MNLKIREKFSSDFKSKCFTVSFLTIIFVKILFCIINLKREYWLDEIYLSYMTRGDLSSIYNFSENSSLHSIFYLLYIFIFRNLFGDSEAVMRLSSALPALISIYFLYQITKKNIDRSLNCFLFITTLYLLIPITNYSLFYFRPYGVALLGVIGSIYYALESKNKNSNKFLLLSSFFLALSVYSSFLYILNFIIISFLINDFLRKEFNFLKFSIVQALFASPILYHVLRVKNEASSLSFSSGPNLSDTFNTITCSLGSFIIFISWIFFNNNSQKNSEVDTFFKTSFLAILVSTLFAFIFFNYFGVSIWVDRYFFWKDIYLVLLCGLVFSKINPNLEFAYAATIILCLLSNQQPIITGGWKKIVDINAAEFSKNPHLVTLVQTGFIETNNLTYLKNKNYEDYFLSPIRYYGFNQNLILLPLNPVNEENKTFIDKIIVKLSKDNLDFNYVFRNTNYSTVEENNEMYLIIKGFKEGYNIKTKICSNEATIITFKKDNKD